MGIYDSFETVDDIKDNYYSAGSMKISIGYIDYDYKVKYNPLVQNRQDIHYLSNSLLLVLYLNLVFAYRHSQIVQEVTIGHIDYQKYYWLFVVFEIH